MNQTIDLGVLDSGKLTQFEQHYFIQKTKNRAAFFKTSLYANDDRRDEELQI